MAIKFFILLSLFFLLGCSPVENGNLSKTIKAFINTEKKPLKTFNRKELENINYPLIEARTNGVVTQILMLPLTIRGAYVNYSSGSGQQITMQGALISKTKGMDVNLLSLEVLETSPLLIKTKPELWITERKRIYGFLNPLNQIVNYEFTCKFTNMGVENLTIVEKKYSLLKILEYCENTENKFENYYWIDKTGFVWKSKQWISPKDIYAYINIINPLN